MGTKEIFPLDPGDMFPGPAATPDLPMDELAAIEVTLAKLRGALTQITLFWRVTFWELCRGGGFCSRDEFVPLEEVLLSQEDRGINFGNFSMFKFRVSGTLASVLADSLQREEREI